MDIESLKQMFDMHIKECDSRDERNVRALDKIETLFKGIWDAQDQLKDVVTRLQIRLAMGLGAVWTLGKIFDYYLAIKTGK